MVLSAVKGIAKSIGFDTRAIYQKVSARSIRAAIREQNLAEMAEKCRKVIPDISKQYTEVLDPAEYDRYWELKMRGLHAFQTRSILEAVDHLKLRDTVIVDIGDSSGNHGIYVKALAEPGKISRVISVNLDPTAVEKVKSKGEEAILSRAEELDLGDEKIDLFTSFEMVEHLTDPTRFLHQMAVSGKCDHFLMSVPYRKVSRVGLQDLRNKKIPEVLTAEGVHIFELSAEDWLLLAEFAGWKPLFTRTYLQYPKKSLMRMTAPMWREIDFEGFFVVLLKRDLSVAKHYIHW